MQNSNINRPPILEITVISAQGLMRKPCLGFSRRLRPFITLRAGAGQHFETYKTRVDEKGGLNPTWGDKFQIPIDQSFFYQGCPGIYLHLYTKHLLKGRTQLGWCLIPAADILNRFLPAGSIRFLSYRLRHKDGSRAHGAVNVAVRLEGSAVGTNVSDQFVSTGIPVML